VASLGPNSRAVLGNTIFQGAGKAITALIGIAMVAILTRYLGAAGFGIYALAFAYLSFFQTFSDLGLSMVGVRQIAKDPASATRVIGSVFLIRFALSLVASISAISLSFALYPGDSRAQLRTAIAIVSLAIFINMLGSIPVTYFQARLQMRYATIAEVTGRTVTFGLLILIVAFGYPLNAVFAAVAGGYGVSALLNYLFARDIFRRPSRPDVALAKRLLLDAAPLGLALVVNSVYFRVDMVILSLFRSTKEVGWYGFSYRILEIVVVLFGLFTLSSYPVIVRYLAEADTARFRRAAQRAFDFLMITTLPTGAIIFLLAQRIAMLLGGDQFQPAVVSIQILAVATAFMGINSFFGIVIIGADRQRDALWLNFAVLALNIALNLALVPAYGYIAAAYTTIASEVAILVGEIYLVRRFLGFTPQVGLVPRVVLAVAVTSVVAYALDRTLMPGFVGTLLVFAAACLVYAGCTWAFGVVRLSEIIELVGIRRVAPDS
jgi:O-antigen/teichoic acid export membrane protein